MSGPSRERSPEILTHPLWGLTVVLGDIATRIERRRATEHTEDTPETRRRAGNDPTATGEVE
jgi:hypothetical protein